MGRVNEWGNHAQWTVDSTSGFGETHQSLIGGTNADLRARIYGMVFSGGATGSSGTGTANCGPVTYWNGSSGGTGSGMGSDQNGLVVYNSGWTADGNIFWYQTAGTIEMTILDGDAWKVGWVAGTF